MISGHERRDNRCRAFSSLRKRGDAAVAEPPSMRDNFTMKSLLSTMIRGAVMAAALAAVSVSAAEEPDLVYRQAGQAIHRGDFDAAIRQLDEAIRSAPKEAKLRGLRGAAWLRKGDYVRGTADLQAAIELNPGDAGAQCRPSSTAALSAEALRHGEEQVKRMLHDRPAMAQFGEETKFLRRLGGAEVRRRGLRRADRLGPFAAAALRRRAPGAGRRRPCRHPR